MGHPVQAPLASGAPGLAAGPWKSADPTCLPGGHPPTRADRMPPKTPVILTSSAPVTEYACPFTSFWKVMASESAMLVIWEHRRNQVDAAASPSPLFPLVPLPGPCATTLPPTHAIFTTSQGFSDYGLQREATADETLSP